MRIDSKNLKIKLRDTTLLIGSTMTIMAGATIAPSLPQIANVFKDGPNIDILVKLVLTIPALFIVIGAPLAGILLDRYGRKTVLITSTILYALSGSSGYLLDSLYAIIAGRAMLGLAVAGTMSGFTTLAADYYTGSKLNKFMGLQSAFMGLGGVIFLLLGGVLADIGWRYPFLIYLSGFFILPGILFFCSEPEIKKQDELNPRSHLNKEMSDQKILFIYILSFLSMVIFYMVPVQMPFYLKSLVTISNTKIGLMISSMTFSFAFVSMGYQKVRGKYPFTSICSAGFLLMGIGYCFFSFANGPGQIFAGLLVSGAGMGLFIPNTTVWLVSLVKPEIRGRSVGILSASLFLGQFFSPIAVQPLVSMTNFACSYAIAGILAIILSITIFTFLAVNNYKNKYST